MTQRQILACFWLISLYVFPLHAQDGGNNALIDMIGKVARYTIRTPQEKIYVHTDNNAYFPGEDLWYAVYTVKAATLTLTPVSRVAYVEVLSPEGRRITREVVRLEDGTGNGVIKLPSYLPPGFYELRAYTREMLNWDADCIYSRIFPVMQIPKKGDTINLHLPPPGANWQPLERPLIRGTKAQVPTVAFFPEGGKRIQGLPSRIAYKMMQAGGTPLDYTAEVFSAQGRHICTTAPLHEGMGSFELPSDVKEAYMTFTDNKGKSHRFDLPAAETEGCVMRVNALGRDSVSILLSKAGGKAGEIMGFTITARGLLVQADTFSLDEPVELVYALKDLREGINQMTLFDTQGNVMAERFYFKMPLRRKADLHIKTNARTLKAFAPLQLNMTVTDADGNPLRSRFSLAVRDKQADIVAGGGHSLYTDLLLTSDLRGYVHRPEYYFASDTPDRAAALDLLLMVQGWRRYDWQEMAEIKPFVLRQPIEDRLLIDGTVIRNYKGEPMGGVKVDIQMYNRSGIVMKGSCHTDSLGRFAFSPDSLCEGTWYVQTAVSQDDKRRNYRTRLNRKFAPAARAYAAPELKYEVPQLSLSTYELSDTTRLAPAQAEKPKTQKDILLYEAVVQGQRAKWDKSRYTWHGGEDAVLKDAAAYYDIVSAVEDLEDDGLAPPPLWDLMERLNDEIYSSNDVNVEYKGSKIVLYLNNSPYRYDRHGVLQSEDIKSVIIKKRGGITWTTNADILSGDPTTANEQPLVTSQTSQTDDFAPASTENSAPTSQPTGGQISFDGVHSGIEFYIFELPHEDKHQGDKRGKRKFLWRGYSLRRQFYSPNYAEYDTPTQTDHRRTLLWQPHVMTDERGQAEVKLFGNAREDIDISISVQGFGQQGQIISFER